MASVERQDVAASNVSINADVIMQVEDNARATKSPDRANHYIEADRNPLIGNPDHQTTKNGHTDSRCVRNYSKNRDKGTLWLTFALRLFLFSPIKWKGGACWISALHLAWFLVYIAKISYLTYLTFQIGHCRERVSSIIEDGYIALHHTLLQKWDASFETLPYPPSTGKFAVYNTDDLRNRINYAVEKFYNAEFEATGYFKKLPGDDITLNIVYFDLIVDQEDQSIKYVYTNVQRSFKPDHGLSKHRDGDGNTMYSYNVTLDLNYNNLSSVLSRVLEVRIAFSLHSLRVSRFYNDSRCLHISGNVSFKDEHHNGQVDIDLTTETVPIECTKMNYSLIDSPQCRNYHGNAAIRVKILAYVSIIGDIAMFLGGIVSLVLGDKNDLGNQPLNQWDEHVVYIGSGCLLTWFSLLRFIKINHKFTNILSIGILHYTLQLLFKTIKRSAVDVIFFLACVTIIFVGFWSCTYIVLGPYHIKFQKLSTTAEALFSMINGDEIFASFALLQEAYIGDVNRVWLFSRIIIYGYVIIFTVLAFNLLIALFNSAYEVVKNSYEQQKEIRKDSIPTTLSYFMCMDFKTDSTNDGYCNILYDNSTCLINCKTCTISYCRNCDCTCGLFSKLIQCMCFNVFTICCCRCEAQARLGRENEFKA